MTFPLVRPALMAYRRAAFGETLAFQADMGFMKGVFIAEDGKLHEGVFGFI